MLAVVVLYFSNALRKQTASHVPPGQLGIIGVTGNGYGFGGISAYATNPAKHNTNKDSKYFIAYLQQRNKLPILLQRFLARIVCDYYSVD
jgi:hypothetical protein